MVNHSFFTLHSFFLLPVGLVEEKLVHLINCQYCFSLTSIFQPTEGFKFNNIWSVLIIGILGYQLFCCLVDNIHIMVVLVIFCSPKTPSRVVLAIGFLCHGMVVGCL
jgi:hypothetical protein